MGRQYTVPCAMGAPLSHHVIYFPQEFEVTAEIGPHIRDADRLRHWVHRLRWDDRRVLYDPTLGYRRQASWDDYAEAYPMSFEGPDVWVTVRVPEGLHRVSLYFFNKDGHRGRNRYRDYLLEVRDHVPSVRAVERKPTLAKTRVREFWGGVHQCFAVKGPGEYFVKIGCNDSFNTVVSGVMVDTLSGWEYEDRMALYAVSDSAGGFAATFKRETGSAPPSGRGFVPDSTPRNPDEGTEPVPEAYGDRSVEAIEQRLPPRFFRRRSSPDRHPAAAPDGRRNG